MNDIKTRYQKKLNPPLNQSSRATAAAKWRGGVHPFNFFRNRRVCLLDSCTIIVLYATKMNTMQRRKMKHVDEITGDDRR